MQIVNCMLSQNYDYNTTIVLLVGNGTGIKQDDLINYFDSIIALKVRKIIMCAFPYSKALTEAQNAQLHKLNNLMFNLTFCHRDRILFFDTNKFIRNFVLTRDTMYVPLSSRRQIATLLAYNIYDPNIVSTIEQGLVYNNTDIRLAIREKKLYSEALKTPHLNDQRRQQRSPL